VDFLGSRNPPYEGVKLWVPFQNALLCYNAIARCTLILQVVAPMLLCVTWVLLRLLVSFCGSRQTGIFSGRRCATYRLTTYHPTSPLHRHCRHLTASLPRLSFYVSKLGLLIYIRHWTVLHCAVVVVEIKHYSRIHANRLQCCRWRDGCSGLWLVIRRIGAARGSACQSCIWYWYTQSEQSSSNASAGALTAWTGLYAADDVAGHTRDV